MRQKRIVSILAILTMAVITSAATATSASADTHTNVARWCGSDGPNSLFNRIYEGHIRVDFCVGYDWNDQNNHIRGYARVVARDNDSGFTIPDAHLDSTLNTDQLNTAVPLASGQDYDTTGVVDFDTSTGGIGGGGYFGCNGAAFYRDHLHVNMRFHGDPTLYSFDAFTNVQGTQACQLGNHDHTFNGYPTS